MEQDQRRYPRSSTALDVTVAAPGNSWKGKTLNLSPHGVKVAYPAESVYLRPGTTVQVSLYPGDEDPALCLPARVARIDPDGLAFDFGILEVKQSRRLKHLVDTLLLGEWQELLEQFGPRRPSTTQAGMPIEPSTPREVREKKVKRDGDLTSQLEVPEEVGLARSKERATSDAEADGDRLKQLLTRVGLDGLRLPSNGVLSRQWRDFLSQFGSSRSGAETSEN